MLDLDRLFKLAKLNSSKFQRDEISSQLSGVLSWIDRLKEVDISGSEPMVNPSSFVYSRSLGLEGDLVADLKDDVVSNSSFIKYNHFTVTKVIK